MNETDESELFNYLNETPEIKDEVVENSKPFMEGICPKCLGTGFIHTVKDNILGLSYQFFGEDSTGERIKKLLVCGCGFKSTQY